MNNLFLSYELKLSFLSGFFLLVLNLFFGDLLKLIFLIFLFFVFYYFLKKNNFYLSLGRYLLNQFLLFIFFSFIGVWISCLGYNSGFCGLEIMLEFPVYYFLFLIGSLIIIKILNKKKWNK